MAALNFNIALTDTGDNGSGPYTMVVLLNPTTAASGGTTVNTDTNATNPQANIFALIDKAKSIVGNKITSNNESDPLN